MLLLPWRKFFWIYAFFTPLGASAHAFGQSFTLPLPVWLYLYGAGAAVVVSFLVIALFSSRKEHSLAYKEYDLSRTGINFFLRNRALLHGIKFLSLFVFVVTLLSAIEGNTSPTDNFASIFIWIVFYLGFTYLSALLGNFWPVVNPYKILTSFWNYKPAITYPSWLGFFPALLFYYMFVWGELLSGGAWANPHNLFLIIVSYCALTFIGIVFVGREAWFQYADFFSVFFKLLSKISPLEYHEGKVLLRAPFIGLVRGEAEHFSLVIFILFMLASTAFDGFRETTTWGSFYKLYVAHGASLGESGWVLASSFALACAPFIFLFFYWSAIVLMKVLLGSRESVQLLMRRFAFSLIPIALAYNIAHYYTLLLVEGQQIIALASDPFEKGWNIFHTANFVPNIGIVGATFVWNSQVAVILLGHIASVYLAHRIALHEFPSRKQAIISQVPMLFLMVLYTVFGLWILSQPMSVGV